MRESSKILADICGANPFTHAVELIRFSLYMEFNGEALLIVLFALAVFLALAIYGYNPARGVMQRKGPGAA
jgi:ABC-2 type transport system permease protein